MAKWISGAIKHPGSFTAAAKRAGKTVSQYARQVLRKGSHSSTRTKRRAVLARTLKRISRNR